MMLARRTPAATFTSSGIRSIRRLWGDVPLAPPDPILGLTEAFKADTAPGKMSLGVGAYRGDDGKPFVLQSVRKAEQKCLDAGLDKEYAGIAGIADFVNVSMEFGYGADKFAAVRDRTVGVQVLSGTGGCRLAGDFFTRFLGKGTPIYMPDPTWANHHNIFRDAQMSLKSYKYYDASTCGLDFNGFVDDVRAAPNGSVFLIHACAHNPTGVDPSIEQWKELSGVMKEKGHFPFFDMAYQGFASGNADEDAGGLRVFVEDGHSLALSQSYAKNFGLYGERVGCLSFVCKDNDESTRVESQLKALIRPMYSNPPINGARIVSAVLNDSELRTEWYAECKGMADRIKEMRSKLRGGLEARGSQRNWKHITDQIGMFCYSGMTEEQVLRLRSDFHIYMTKNGRISMAGVTSGNVDALADAMHAVTQ